MAIILKNVKLGRKPAVIDPRTLTFASYIKPGSLPVHPAAQDWTSGITDWGMLGNDKYGDCAFAGMAHAIMVWCAAHGVKITFDVQAVLGVYAAVTGFDPATGANDNGAALYDVLRWMSKNGFLGHKLAAYVSVDPKNADEVREAIYLTGCVYAGFNVPTTIEQQNGIWHVVHGPVKFEGGHCVPLPKYSPNSFTCLTWGSDQEMTDEFFTSYFDEVWALVSLDWVSPAMTAPNRFDFAQLMADRSAL